MQTNISNLSDHLEQLNTHITRIGASYNWSFLQLELTRIELQQETIEANRGSQTWEAADVACDSTSAILLTLVLSCYI